MLSYSSPSLYAPFHAFFFFNDTATTEIYTLSLHDALPISGTPWPRQPRRSPRPNTQTRSRSPPGLGDRKSTRLNSSHANISYAVFCLKKKKPDAVIVPLPSDHHRILAAAPCIVLSIPRVSC